MIKINETEINAESFAFDGCHKFYILNDPDSVEEAREYEYDIYPISSLPEAFVCSCPLRFINEWGGDFNTIVGQCANKVVFEGIDIPFEFSEGLESAEYEITINGNKITLESFEG